jgi:hypothetical protein
MDPQTRYNMAKDSAISILTKKQLILEHKSEAEKNGNKRQVKEWDNLLSDIDKLIRDYGLNRYAERLSK